MRPPDHRVDIVQAGCPALQHLPVEAGDPLAVGVVRLVFDPEAPDLRKPPHRVIVEAGSDFLDQQTRGLGHRFHEHVSAVQRFVEEAMQALAVIFAGACRPGIEHRPQRARGRQVVKRPRLVEKIALAVDRVQFGSRQQPAHGFLARGHQLVRPLAVEAGDQHALDGAIVHPVEQSAERHLRDDGRPQLQTQRAAVFHDGDEAQIANHVFAQLLARQRRIEGLRELAGPAVPQLALVVEQIGLQH